MYNIVAPQLFLPSLWITKSRLRIGFCSSCILPQRIQQQKETITFLCPDEPTQVLYSVVQGDYPSKHHIPSAAFPKNTQALYTHCNQSTRSIPWSYEDGHTRVLSRNDRLLFHYMF